MCSVPNRGEVWPPGEGFWLLLRPVPKPGRYRQGEQEGIFKRVTIDRDNPERQLRDFLPETPADFVPQVLHNNVKLLTIVFNKIIFIQLVNVNVTVKPKSIEYLTLKLKKKRLEINA